MIPLLPVVLAAGLVWGGWHYLRRPRSGGGLVTGSPLSIYASKPRPCSSFAAAWLLSAMGKSPADASDDYSWRSLDKSLWDAVNITDHSQPWSGIPAVQKVFGGVVAQVKGLTTSNVPRLTPGLWHFVQRWDWSASPPKGHAYFVRALPDGTFRIVQSSLSRGFRDTIESTWTPTGVDVAVVALPTIRTS